MRITRSRSRTLVSTREARSRLFSPPPHFSSEHRCSSVMIRPTKVGSPLSAHVEASLIQSAVRVQAQLPPSQAHGRCESGSPNLPLEEAARDRGQANEKTEPRPRADRQQ